jgi:hypothetical protein
MAKAKHIPSLNRVELDKHKTTYAVGSGGWIENYLGHGQHYDAQNEGKTDVTVELLPVQAEYYLSSGQIRPIPGQTKGYPSDAETGEAIELDAETRARIEAAPGIGQAGDGVENALGQGQTSEPAVEVAHDQAASLVEESASAETVDQATDSTSKTRRSGKTN